MCPGNVPHNISFTEYLFFILLISTSCVASSIDSRKYLTDILISNSYFYLNPSQKLYFCSVSYILRFKALKARREYSHETKDEDHGQRYYIHILLTLIHQTTIYADFCQLRFVDVEETKDKGLRQREEVLPSLERQVALNIYSRAFELKDKRSILGIEGEKRDKYYTF